MEKVPRKTPNIWPLLLVAVCKVIGCSGNSNLQAIPVFSEILLPPLPLRFEVCFETTAKVEFLTIVVKDTKFTKRVLGKDEFLCLSAGAAPLQGTNFNSCAKEAFDQEFNAFFFNDQNQCYGSNQPLAEGACQGSGSGFIVYIAEVPITDFVLSAPEFESFSVTEVTENSFVVNFKPSCYGIDYELRSEGQVIQTVKDSDTVTSNEVAMPPCSDILLALQAIGNGRDLGDEATAMLQTLPVPDVIDLYVENFVVGQSFDVYFTATCPDYYSFMLELKSKQFPSVTSELTISDVVLPCTNITPILHVYDVNGKIEGATVVGPMVTTPDVPDVNDFSVESEGDQEYLISFTPQCSPNTFTYDLEVDGEPPVAVNDGDILKMENIEMCSVFSATLKAKKDGAYVNYEKTTTFTSELDPTVNAFEVSNIKPYISFDVIIDSECPDDYEYEVTVGDKSCRPIKSGESCPYSVQPCSLIEEIKLNVYDGAGIINSINMTLTSIATPVVPDVYNFFVTAGSTSGTFIVNFEPKCPEANFKYEAEAQGSSFPVNDGDSVTLTGLPPCSLLEFKLKATLDGASTGYEITTSVLTHPVPDVSYVELTDINLYLSFKVAFDAQCSDQYAFKLEFDGQLFDDVRSGDPIPYSVPPCKEVTPILMVYSKDGSTFTGTKVTGNTVKTPDVATLRNFAVTNEGTNGPYRINFDKVCPDYSVDYIVSVAAMTIQDITDNTIVCPQLEFTIHTEFGSGGQSFSETVSPTPQTTC